MNIIQCKVCKKPFQSFSSKICHECLDKIDRDFIVVRDFIYDNPRANVDKVSEETEVDRAIILHLLKEGRLQLDNPDGSILRCEVCKKAISSGRMCKDCMGKVANTMQKNVGPAKPAESAKPNEATANKHAAKINSR